MRDASNGVMPGYFAAIDIAQAALDPGSRRCRRLSRRGAASTGHRRTDALEDPEPRLAVVHGLEKRLELERVA